MLSIPTGFRMGKGKGRSVISKVCPHSSKLLGVNRLPSQKGLTNSLHSAAFHQDSEAAKTSSLSLETFASCSTISLWCNEPLGSSSIRFDSIMSRTLQ